MSIVYSRTGAEEPANGAVAFCAAFHNHFQNSQLSAGPALNPLRPGPRAVSAPSLQPPTQDHMVSGWRFRATHCA